MHTDHFPRTEIRRSHLIFQTALVVLVIGLGMGIFSDSTGFVDQEKIQAQNFHGFKTVNVSHFTR